MIVETLEILFVILTALMISYLVRHYIFTLTVLKKAKKCEKTVTEGKITYQPNVSILISARNEEKVIGRILQRMTELTYPKAKTQIIVINDASKDATGKIAEEYSRLHGYIKVIHRSKEEGGTGKAAALNVGFKHTEGEIVFCFDADYYPQTDILEELTREFVDPEVGAVQGRIIVLNEPQNSSNFNLLKACTKFEY